jgi:hypothetical protein
MMKNDFGDEYMSRTGCYEWVEQFKDCRQLTHDDPRLERPSTSCDDIHVEQFREIVF